MKEMTSNLCSAFLETCSLSTNVEVLWNKFKNICSECINYVPSKLSNSKNKKQPYAWISHQIKRPSHKKQQLYNNAKSSQSLNLWQAYYKVKKEMHKT